MTKPTTWLQLAEIADVYAGVATRTPRRPGGKSTARVLTVRALKDEGIDAGAVSALECLGRIDERYAARVNDVVVAARSTRLGAALVPPELDGVLINATLIGIRCLPVFAPRLLLAYLQHPDGEAAIEGLVQTGTAQMNLTVRALSTLTVPVPPLADQQRLVALLTAADEAYATATQAATVRRRLAQAVVIGQLNSA